MLFYFFFVRSALAGFTVLVVFPPEALAVLAAAVFGGLPRFLAAAFVVTLPNWMAKYSD
jgi:hypothetical protein